jgi:hypothetical protein
MTRTYPWHRLTEKDTVNRTAVCSICGPTQIKRHGSRQWKCIVVHKRQARRDNLYRRFGISWQEWDDLLIAQSGLCAICTRQMTSPYVDHCHQTGRVRGLLCQNCNSGIGHFREDPWTMHAAIDYLLAASSTDRGVTPV